MITWQMIKRSLGISAIVGTILNGINQGGAMLGDEAVNWGHLLLNYLVPFLVASYSAWANTRGDNRSETGPSTPDSP